MGGGRWVMGDVWRLACGGGAGLAIKTKQQKQREQQAAVA